MTDDPKSRIQYEGLDLHDKTNKDAAAPDAALPQRGLFSMRYWILLLLVVVVGAALVWMGGKGEFVTSDDDWGNPPEAPPAKIEVEDNGGQATRGSALMEPIELTADDALTASPATADLPEVIVHTSQGDIRIKLFAEEAPQTVTNFLDNYVDRGSYRDTLVHYVEKDYMMIAGGYTSGYEKIPARAAVVYEGDNGLRNRRGTVAVNRHPDYIHSGTTEFFFNLADNEFLDEGDALAGGGTEPGESVSAPGYCVFGEIVEGIEVLDKIGAVEVKDREGFPSTPAEPVIVISIERVR